MKISILGLGWLGLPLAHHLVLSGHQIKGSYSNIKRKKELEEENIPAFQVHLTDTEIEGQWSEFIQGSELIIINIPPRHKNDPEILFSNKIKALIEKLPKQIKIIFVSSTSVYGNISGLISEKSKPEPVTLSGIELLKSEQSLQEVFNTKVAILRFAGLIGPKRNPGQFIAGRTNLPNPKGSINLIHQTDCIQIIDRIIQQNAFGEIFNGCSSQHPERKEYYSKMVEKLNNIPPTFTESLNKLNSKEIDNSKSINTLNIQYTNIYDL